MAKVKMLFTARYDYKGKAYEAGQVYEIEGEDVISRWIKRGCEIVKDVPTKVEQKEDPKKEQKLADSKVSVKDKKE